MSPRKKLTALLVVALTLACAPSAACFLRTKYVVPVLMYHRVVPRVNPRDGLMVSTRAFERQMRFLKAGRYNIVTLQALADLLKNKKPVPPKTIAITFDDGYLDNYTFAFPILREYNVPVTLFVIVREEGRPQGDRLNWDQIKKMRDSGLVVIGSHALGPDPLIKIRPEEALREEIFDSKKVLEEKLGAAVYAFSYPEGMFTPHIRQLVVDAGYTVAVATKPGKGYPSDDLFALKRLRISEECRSEPLFWLKSSGFYTWFKESWNNHKRKHAT